MKCGFLTVSQESVTLGNVSYHDFHGILIDDAERELIAKNMGPVNRVNDFLLVNFSISFKDRNVK